MNVAYIFKTGRNSTIQLTTMNLSRLRQDIHGVEVVSCCGAENVSHENRVEIGEVGCLLQLCGEVSRSTSDLVGTSWKR